ncbi:MAG: AsmA family protein [Alphaproteobacteria bacterium]|nr:MAG: AsmA family protein [Alphaproteobacteria bacterium]
MSKPLRIGLIVLGALVVLVVALPFLVPVDAFKGPIEKAVSDATGREFTIAGDISLKLVPQVELEVKDATLLNVSGGKHDIFARMERASLGVKLGALLSRRVEITHFTLNEPVLHLEISKGGAPNWVFAPNGSDNSHDTNAATVAAEDGNTSEAISNVSLSEVAILGGTVTYDNLQEGSSYEFSQVNMGLSMASLDAPFDAAGSMVYNGETVNVNLHVDELRALTTDQKTPLSLGVQSKLVSLTLNGSYQGGQKNLMAGKTSLSIPSLEKFNHWTGHLISKDDVKGVVTISGDLSGGNSRYQFKNASVAFDDMAGTGEVTIDVSGTRPKLSGILDVNAIDLRPYMGDDGAPREDNTGKAIEPWSADRTSFEALKAANIDLKLSAQSIKVLNYDIGKSALKVRVTSGKLVADLTEFGLYGGAATGQLTLDGTRNVPSLTASFDLTNVDAEPLMLAATSRKLVTGKGNFNFTVSTSGTSLKDWMEGLSGSGKLFLNDGEIIGVNLTRMVQIISSLTGLEVGKKKQDEIEGETGTDQSTEFVEMGGTFSLSKGVLNSADFRLLNEIISLSGVGDVNIGKQTIDFNIDPGVNTEDGGAKVALRVHGPWNDIHFSPNLQRMLEKEIKDRLGIKEDSPAGGLIDLFLKNQKPDQN